MDLHRRILVVEDERIVAKDIQRNLQRLGYDAPDTAASSEEALRYSTATRPDLVLMDIRIEGEVDGIETAALLRERFDVPIVFLTAYADGPTLKRATETQPYGYLLKPVRPDELRTTVEIALHKHRIDRQVREREKWFSTTLKSIADAIITVDVDNRVTYMNPAAETLIGSSLEQSAGRSSTDVMGLLDEAEKPLSPTPLERVLRDGEVVNLNDARLRQSTGSVVRIGDSAAAVTEQNEVLGAVMVFRDISEQQKLQQHVLASDRMASVGLLAAGVAHEVNNPLAAALMSLELATASAEALSQDKSQNWDALKEGLRDASFACQRVRSIVSDLRVFSREESIVTHRVDVQAVMESTLRLARGEVRHRARVVRTSRPTPPIQATESRLGQVFLNLIVNAAQAIAEGTADTNEIRVTTGTADNGHALIEIEDTGVGMSKETLARLFTPFFTTKPANIGTGLGLMLCRRIVDDLHGTLTIESAVGRGTCVRVTFPPSQNESPQRASLNPAVAVRVDRGRVLLIDDDAIVGKTIERALRDVHTVTVTASAESALEHIRAGERFDVILCDLMMPSVTGMDLHAMLKLSHPELAARMVFMTGGAFTANAHMFLESISNPRLDKPFDRKKLIQVVNEMIEHTRASATAS